MEARALDTSTLVFQTGQQVQLEIIIVSNEHVTQNKSLLSINSACTNLDTACSYLVHNGQHGVSNPPNKKRNKGSEGHCGVVFIKRRGIESRE